MVARVSDPIDARVMVLLAEAERGQLSICAGAGLSIGLLPDGRGLAKILCEALRQRMAGYECEADDDLLGVADAADGLPGGREALQRLVVSLAPFDSAKPDVQHRLLALLACEGAVRLLVTNWDTCVERSVDEDLKPIRNVEEAQDGARGSLLKIHGCATRPTTLLVTSEQLAGESPLWTRTHFASTLTTTTMVFVGVGDIAGYARERITELASEIPHAKARVVSPSVEEADGWQSSQWRELLPALPVDNRLGMTAADFASQLASGWVRLLLDAFLEGRPADDQLSDEVAVLKAAIGRLPADEALGWLRGATVRPEIGISVARGRAALAALTALAVLLSREGEDQPFRVLRSLAVKLGDKRLEVLLDDRPTRSTEVERAVIDRVQRAAVPLEPGAQVTVLCAAPLVIGPRRGALEDVDVLDPDGPIDSLVDGPARVSVNVIYSQDLMEAA